MPKTALTPSVLSLLLLLAPTAIAGCGAFGEDADASGKGGASGSGGSGGASDGPKAPPVSGTPVDDELVENLGIFVTASGSEDGDGTRTRPLARIQAGIDLGKKLGKRVYVCTGTYREALTLADSISVIGGLGCAKSDAWTSGQPKSRVEAPSSPAMSARGITTDTRVEGLDVVAPDATEPSASSIGLLAVHSPKLVIARTKITAGNAANGADGADGIQLTPSGTGSGAPVVSTAECMQGSTCDMFNYLWTTVPGGAGGTNACSGAPGHDGEPGGRGGTGGLQEIVWDDVLNMQLMKNYLGATNAPRQGEARSGAAGATGADGANGSEMGAFDESGYVAAHGAAGANGAPGRGGSGGTGQKTHFAAAGRVTGTVFRGWGGAGGGAGGCPGLAGTGGQGGGASTAVILLESPVVLDAAELHAGRGGNAGRGGFGSDPTAGGAAGPSASWPAAAGQPGGAGGSAGVSGNGSAGPSIALVTKGAAPTITGTTTTTAGEPGAGVEARSRTGALGNVSVIPATPAGVAKATLSL